MCGRLTLAEEEARHLADEIAADLDVTDANDYRPRFNIAPSEPHWIARIIDGGDSRDGGDGTDGRRKLHRASWGFVKTIGPPKTPGAKPPTKLVFNTVSESAYAKPMFRRALAERRCIVLADGFYEWRGDRGDRRPYHFTRTDGGLLLFAGIYDAPVEGEPLARFSILTTTPSADVAPFHDRMACILDLDAVEGWLRHGGIEHLRPPRDGLLRSAPANPAMNRTGKDAPDGPECLRAPADKDNMQATLDLFRGAS